MRMSMILRATGMALLAVPAFSVTYLPLPLAEINGANGSSGVLAGAYLCTFAAGTTTPQSSYSDSTGTNNTNPVVLDSNGRASLWGSSLGYKLVMYSGGSNACPSTGTVLWSQDNVYATFPQVTALNSLTGGLNLLGTVNQVNVISGGSSITISLPQNLNTAANVIFANVAASTSIYVTGAYPDGMNAPVFASSATGTQQGFTVNGGTANILGNGTINAQSLNLHDGLLVATGAGSFGFDASGNLTAASIASGAGGMDNEIQVNCTGAVCGYANLKYFPSSNILQVTGSGSQGVVAPEFNCTNTGTTACIQQASSYFSIHGDGNALFQGVYAGVGYYVGITNSPGLTATRTITTTGGTCALAFVGGILIGNSGSC